MNLCFNITPSHIKMLKNIRLKGNIFVHRMIYC